MMYIWFTDWIMWWVIVIDISHNNVNYLIEYSKCQERRVW